MSHTGQTRPRADLDRGASTTYSAHTKPRGAPSSRVGVKERPLSSGEVIPEDSASNVGGKRATSGSYRINGGSTVLGKRTERVRETTREKLQVRTRSPGKADQRPDVDSGTLKSRVPSRQASQRVDRLTSAQAQKQSPDRCGFRRKARYTQAC